MMDVSVRTWNRGEMVYCLAEEYYVCIPSHFDIDDSWNTSLWVCEEIGKRV